MRGRLLPSVVRRIVISPGSLVKIPINGVLKFKNSKNVIPRSYSSNNARPSTQPWTQHPLPTGVPETEITAKLSQPQDQPRLAYIALGSNMGNRVAWIEMACNRMGDKGIKVKRTSGLWETKPMYLLDQDNFLNGVCEVETTLGPLALLDALQAIENFIGRKKLIEKGPRTIDLDILLYENEVVDHPRLTIPHPGMIEREFVLRPLAELIPGKPLDPKSPWKVTQDYLNSLPPSSSPISTLTPLGTKNDSLALHALDRKRQTHVMAIYNATPDSFSDGGPNRVGMKFLKSKFPLMIKQGATIIDVGGQSTAPGAPVVDPNAEAGRILRALMVLREPMFQGIITSVDTYRAVIAEAAASAGIDIINDISAGQMDPKMFPTMARLGKTVCLMHMRGTPATMDTLTDYSPEGVISTVAKELLERVAEAEAAGIRRWRIILDPGIGFAKTQDQNLEILRRMDELRDWPGLRGLPWLVGSSRKRFIGSITDVKLPNQRDWGTAATVTAAIRGGADIVRVHEIKGMAKVVKMSDAIYRI